MENLGQLEDLVYDLNEHLSDKTSGEISLYLLCNGSTRSILLNDIVLWRDDEDTREFNEETNSYEPLKEFIEKAILERGKTLHFLARTIQSNKPNSEVVSELITKS